MNSIEEEARSKKATPWWGLGIVGFSVAILTIVIVHVVQNDEQLSEPEPKQSKPMTEKLCEQCAKVGVEQYLLDKEIDELNRDKLRLKEGLRKEVIKLNRMERLLGRQQTVVDGVDAGSFARVYRERRAAAREQRKKIQKEDP
jgi:hypothetical protein